MERTLSAVIVDDEPLAIRRLERALADVPHVRVAGTARDGAAALTVVGEQKPDLLFIDIQMPALNGLEVVQRLDPDDPPAVIFVTAYSRFAPNAFRVAAVDYLLKPVEVEAVAEAVGRARDRLAARQASQRIAELQQVVEALRADSFEAPGNAYETEFWAPERHGRVRIPAETIDYVKAERDYVRLHTARRSYLFRDSIQRLSERLNPSAFLRVHRSALVNLTAVSRIARTPTGGLRMVLRDDTEIPVGRRFVRTVRERMGL